MIKEYRKVPDSEMEVVDMILRENAQDMQARFTFETHWNEVAELIDPPSRNTFTINNWNTPGEKKTDRQVDSTGMLALGRFAAICDSLLTPRNNVWHQLRASDPYVMKDRDTQLWFEDTTHRLFEYRYSPNANFSMQNQKIYKNLGAYGTGSMFIDALSSHKHEKGLRYQAQPVGSIFLRENHQGMIDGFTRWFRFTAAQVISMFPEDFVPPQVWEAYEKKSQQMFAFLHRVNPRGNEYDPDRIDAKGKPWSSCYVSLDCRCLMQQEGGFNSFPLPTARYEVYGNEIYGRGPAFSVLPTLKTLNAEKRMFLKQGHRAADPVLLTADDGLVDMSLRPGAMNKGGWSSQGKPLVGVLPTGNIQVTIEMMQEERGIVDDAFLVSLYKVLSEHPSMTATQVMELVNEKGILVAPTVGAQQGGYLGPTIERELDLMSEQGLLLPMPPRLQEARGHYNVVYTSPLAKAMKAQEAAGFMRTIESVRETATVSQDPSLFDPFEFDVAIPAMADINGVPASWMASADKMEAKRQNRAKAQEQQAQIQAMPGQAAMINAKAKSGQQQAEQEAG